MKHVLSTRTTNLNRQCRPVFRTQDYPRRWFTARVQKIIANLKCRGAADNQAKLVADRLVKKVRTAKREFWPKCGKFSGAVAVEYIRRQLRTKGLEVSARDVFIRGVPIELDLIVPRKGTIPGLGLLYEPADVRAVLEVKNCGCFGEQAVKSVRTTFKQIRKLLPDVTCIYVTLEERPTYKCVVTDTDVGAPACTLAWHKDTDGPYWPTTDWRRLVSLLRNASRGGLGRIRETRRHT